MSLSRRQLLQYSAALGAAGVFGSHGASSSALAEYRSLDATAMADLVRRGEASPLELLDMAIGRTEEVNPRVNAVVLKHYEMAREAINAGLPDGPLKGVPFLLKDLGVALKGTVTTEGSRLFKDQSFDYDSTLVERYKKAGLVTFGKTNSPEFGSSPSTESQLFGDTRNPWNLEHSAGGSSGGAAAAVAAGIIPAAHASDGGGSIRIPSSACGLFGLKPTRGRVPMGPGSYETRAGCSAMHVVSRSVRDSALLLDISQGAALGDPYAAPHRERPYTEELSRAPGKLRIALMTAPIIPIPVDPQCVVAAEKAAQLCASLGHSVEIASPTLDVEALYAAFGMVGNVLVANKVGKREEVLGRAAREDELEKINWVNRRAGDKTSAIEYSRGRNTLHQASRRLAQFMQSYDVILSPTMALLPPKLGVLTLNQEFESFMMAAAAASAFTGLYNMTGQPAMSVPLHWSDTGLPVGVQFTGRFGDEGTLFRLAAQLEQAAPWFDKIAAT
jgi:amidase